MNKKLTDSYLTNLNISYIEDLYKLFLKNPNYIDISWHEVFSDFLNLKTVPESLDLKINEEISVQNSKISTYFTSSGKAHDTTVNLIKQAHILQLIHAFRFYGHYHANIDPLKLYKRKKISDLDLSFYHFDTSDLNKEFYVGSFSNKRNNMKLSDLYELLNKTYCGSIGIEYMHISNFKERKWIQERIEITKSEMKFDAKEKKRFLTELIAAKEVEHHLSMTFPGSKRFSLEGNDALIPMLKDIIRCSGLVGIKEIVLGMTHRGRLNVLINVLGKDLQEIFNEFLDYENSEFSGSGDVKYHQGFSCDINIGGTIVHLSLAFNPSHLEIIYPVVLGSTRARIDKLDKESKNKVLPIIIHGDASIIGQGVVQEALNMSNINAYKTEGTIHIVINNQIGFTTCSWNESRSTQYCTDIIKMIQVPIFHVNADDLEAVIFVTRTALEFRNTFGKDVAIDLVGYRRHGHNEIDNPYATQPLMYKKIKNHLPLCEIYFNSLEKDNVITSSDCTAMISAFRGILKDKRSPIKEMRVVRTYRSFIKKNDFDYNLNKMSHKIDKKHLKKLAYNISIIPNEIKMQEQVSKIYSSRINMAGGKRKFDWGGAELLAYATLIDSGFSVRLSGEDTVRGTFFHRHAVIYNQKNGSSYTPLGNIRSNNGNFHVWNSVLSEEATLAFEYGYSISSQNTLVIWEAQFGDFANGAQIVIDQFISSSEQKWGQTCGIVMFLPHGYEGQGPEHSSARLERYLQLCAEKNIQVCYPSTPAQIYHVLLRQALYKTHKPLIIMSAKSLLRHPLAISSLDELSNGVFQTVIGEVDKLSLENIKRIIICSGKVYYDLINQRRKNNQYNVAIIRIEQLYPFPLEQLKKLLTSYNGVKDFVWCQEEPKNQGAWYHNRNYFQKIISNKAILHYVGRSASASPAVGCLSVHKEQQKRLIYDALNVN